MKQVFRLFFWYKGQISRKTYWISNLVLCGIYLTTTWFYTSNNFQWSIQWTKDITFYITDILLLYSSVCLHIKRLHDINFKFSEWIYPLSFRKIRRACYFLPFYILFVCIFIEGKKSKTDRKSGIFSYLDKLYYKEEL